MDIYIDPTTHDLVLEEGVFRYTSSEREVIRQRLLITLKAFRGEWFANILFGVPWLKNEENNLEILGKKDKALFDVEVKSAILSVEGITGLYSYESFILDRVATITFVATSEDGPINVENLEIN